MDFRDSRRRWRHKSPSKRLQLSKCFKIHRYFYEQLFIDGLNRNLAEKQVFFMLTSVNFSRFLDAKMRRLARGKVLWRELHLRPARNSRDSPIFLTTLLLIDWTETWHVNRPGSRQRLWI